MWVEDDVRSWESRRWPLAVLCMRLSHSRDERGLTDDFRLAVFLLRLSPLSPPPACSSTISSSHIRKRHYANHSIKCTPFSSWGLNLSVDLYTIMYHPLPPRSHALLPFDNSKLYIGTRHNKASYSFLRLVNTTCFFVRINIYHCWEVRRRWWKITPNAPTLGVSSTPKVKRSQEKCL